VWPARVRDKTGTSPLFFRSPCPTRPSLLRICGARPLSTERLEYGGEEEGGSARAPPAGRPPVRCDAGQLVPPRPPRTPFRPRAPLPVDHTTRARSHSGGERTSFAGHGHGIGRTFFATRSGRRRRRRALGPRPRVGDGGARLGVALHEWRRRRRGARKRCFLLAGEGGGPEKRKCLWPRLSITPATHARYRSQKNLAAQGPCWPRVNSFINAVRTLAFQFSLGRAQWG
jgi:hypothetical protein